MCVCEERERECVSVYVNLERECVCLCVCEERERECVSVCV